MSSHNLPEREQNRPLPPAETVIVRVNARWQEGIDFEAGWAALLTRFAPSRAYVTRLGGDVEMVAEFAEADEAVRFTVHLETVLGVKASLEKASVH